MSSTDPTTIGVHRALHEALNSAREARHRLDDGDATPDLDDLVELSTLLAGLSESRLGGQLRDGGEGAPREGLGHSSCGSGSCPRRAGLTGPRRP